MALKIINVSNAAELAAALAGATGNEKILLAQGDYGDLRLGQYGTKLNNTGTVTIGSADPAHKADFTSLRLDTVSKLTFDNISVTTPYTDPLRPPVGLAILSSQDISVQNSTIVGPIVAPDQANSATGAYAGAAFGTGIQMRFSDTVSLTNNTIRQFQNAVYAQRTNKLQFNNNEISAFSNDAFDAATLTNSSISGNYMHDPKGSDDSTYHPDFIQIWTAYETSNSHDLTINGNVFVNNSVGGGGKNTGDAAAATSATGNSQYMQTILLQQQSSNPALDYQNVTISNNLIFGNQAHAAYVADGHDLTISNNTIISNNDGTDPKANGATIPGVVLDGRISDADIRNNVTPLISVSNGATDVSQSGNYLTDQTDPSAPNYVGKLFVDTFGTVHTDYSQGDLQALPDSVVAKNRLGSSLTWTLDDVTHPVLYVDMQPGAGLDRQTFDYDTTALFKTPVDLTGASIALDFGDGSDPVNSFEGSHTYATPGVYDVTAAIKLADGQTVSGTQGVRVQTPVVLRDDFDDGLIENGNPSTQLSTGHAYYAETDLGRSLHLGGSKSYATFGRAYDTTGNEALTISFDFKKDAAADYGTMFTQAGTTTVALTAAGQLSVTLADGAGNSFTQKDNVDVADTNWHQVTIAFDGTKGAAEYFMDGKLVGVQNGYTTGQVTKGNWAPNLGTPWNSSLSASYDDVEYLDGAMTKAQVGQSWTTLQQSLGSGGTAPRLASSLPVDPSMNSLFGMSDPAGGSVSADDVAAAAYAGLPVPSSMAGLATEQAGTGLPAMTGADASDASGNLASTNATAITSTSLDAAQGLLFGDPGIASSLGNTDGVASKGTQLDLDPTDPGGSGIANLLTAAGSMDDLHRLAS